MRLPENDDVFSSMTAKGIHPAFEKVRRFAELRVGGLSAHYYCHALI